MAKYPSRAKQEADLVELPAVGPPAVQGVRLVGELKFKSGFDFTATSLPGHLVHLVVSGHVRQEQSGRWYDLRAGNAVWYHEDELVRGSVLKGPWRFFTCNFVAPSIAPPPFERRVRRAPAGAKVAFETLLRAWRDTRVDPALREMRVHARLLDLLALLWPGRGQPFVVDPSARLWWDVETQLRNDLSVPSSLDALEAMSGRSRATIARSCLRAVGISPMKRIKQVKMSLARALVRTSELQIKEIASRVGYGRVHEFSRDYRKHFGTSARVERGTPLGRGT
jgi:AraC-like DNA-binding protein